MICEEFVIHGVIAAINGRCKVVETCRFKFIAFLVVFDFYKRCTGHSGHDVFLISNRMLSVVSLH